MFDEGKALWQYWWWGWRSCLSKLSKPWTLRMPTNTTFSEGKAPKLSMFYSRRGGMTSSPFHPTLSDLDTKEAVLCIFTFYELLHWKQLLWLLPAEALGQNYTLLGSWANMLPRYHSLWPLAWGMLEWGDWGIGGIKTEERMTMKHNKNPFVEVKVFLQIHS